MTIQYITLQNQLKSYDAQIIGLNNKLANDQQFHFGVGRSTKEERIKNDQLQIENVNARKENDLCRYIPMTTGGYMHHFTLRKLKNRNPAELSALIEKFIEHTVVIDSDLFCAVSGHHHTEVLIAAKNISELSH